MDKRQLLHALAALGLGATAGPAPAREDRFRIGLLLPLTGPFTTTGRQLEAGARLYLARHGSTVAGKKVELIVRDDTGLPDSSKRLAQELLVNDKVHVLAGFGLTPQAFATAPLATQSRTPMVVMSAATSSITKASPYIVRSSFTVPQVVTALADWAWKDGLRRVVSLVTDYAPGIDSETYFKDRFVANGGTLVETLRVPLRNPDFAPFLQKVRDLQPEALFAFVPSGAGSSLMKQFAERGLAQAGIRMIAEGSVTDDDILNDMGDVAIGIVTAHHYSAAHDSAVNRTFVEAYQKTYQGARPNFMAVGAYDGMRVICEALKATRGDTAGEALLAAMKGQIFESPRGPMYIDAQTRDVVHNIYIRRVEKHRGELFNVEIATQQDVKDPGKAR